MLNDNIIKSAEKIKCPVCETQFVPEYFHLEKVDYEFGNHNHKFKLKFLKSNGHVKPLHVLRKTWVTSCPECSYILRFAAELGDKEYSNGKSSRVNFKKFNEEEYEYQYNFRTIKKPYKDILFYEEEYINQLKNEIKLSLDDLDLYRWGKIYQKWNQENQISTFKFLVMFCSGFENYCEKLNDWTNLQNFSYKVDSTPFSTNLKKLLLKIDQLQKKAIDEFYELDENDSIFIKNTFHKLMFEIIFNNLKKFELNNYLLRSQLSEYQKGQYSSELKKFLLNYIEGNLKIGAETINFVNSLLDSLNIPDQHKSRKNVVSKIKSFSISESYIASLFKNNKKKAKRDSFLNSIKTWNKKRKIQQK